MDIKETEIIQNNTNLTIRPSKALLDEELHITVNGLSAKQHVTFVSRVDESGARFYSYAYYICDDDGQIDLKTMPAEDGGCYEGIEPMGLVWSQIQEPGQKSGRRLVKADITSPIIMEVYVLKDFVIAGDCLNSIVKKQWLAHAKCERIHMADGVERIEVRDGRLLGTMFVPGGSGPFPGVIDLFGGIGGITEHRSALLASRGIAAFSLGYLFKDSDKNTLKSDIEYFEEGVDYLLSHPKVKKPYAGIIGVSKGAEIALLTASLCHKIKACVEINAPPVLTTLSHSYKNEEFPAIMIHPKTDAMYDGQGYTLYHANFTYYHEGDVTDYIVPVEKGQCEFLLIHGSDDQVIAPLAAEYIPKRLKAHNKTNYRVLLYPGAGHLLEPPHSPHFFMTYQGLFQLNAIWGGHARQHARAQEDAWKQVLGFFRKTLGDEAVPHSNL